MAPPISADDPGMQAVLTAFQNASDTSKAVRSGVTAAGDSLQWSGDASTAYRNSLASWLEGLSRVDTGLAEMDEAMTGHKKATDGGEEVATGSSGWYH
jgi:uncharacterized protein YukE